MRYVNATKSPKFNAIANKLLNPGDKTREITDLSDMLVRLADGSGMLSIQLSEGDFKALEKFMSKVGVDKDRLKAAIRKGREDPRGEKGVYEAMEPSYIAKQKAISKMMAEHEEKEKRINAESNFILPDGTPVSKEDSNVVAGLKAKESEVVPRIVEKPESPLDILAHNAKVSTERAQYAPLTGKAAVIARKGIPGMPNLPGIEKQMENLAKEQAMSSAQKAGVTPVLTSDMLKAGEKNNYGRKP